LLEEGRAFGYDTRTCMYMEDVLMATKTISIDLEAYKRLKHNKKENESFSQVIKRIVKPPFDLDAWLKAVASHPISEKAAKAIEEQYDGRLKRSRGRM